MSRRFLSHARSPLLAILMTFGCSSWQPVTEPSPLAAEFMIPSTVRLTDAAGRRTVGINAFGRGPSIILARRDQTWDSMPRRQVTLVERRRFDAGKTVGLVALVGLAGLVAVEISLSNSMW